MTSYTLLDIRNLCFEPLSMVFIHSEKAYKESLVSFCGVAKGGERPPAQQPPVISCWEHNSKCHLGSLSLSSSNSSVTLLCGGHLSKDSVVSTKLGLVLPLWQHRPSALLRWDQITLNSLLAACGPRGPFSSSEQPHMSGLLRAAVDVITSSFSVFFFFFSNQGFGLASVGC